MPSDRAVRALELFVRLVGVAIAAAGLLFVPSAPLFGVPLFAVGSLFALRPATAGELLDAAASLA